MPSLFMNCGNCATPSFNLYTKYMCRQLGNQRAYRRVCLVFSSTQTVLVLLWAWVPSLNMIWHSHALFALHGIVVSFGAFAYVSSMPALCCARDVLSIAILEIATGLYFLSGKSSFSYCEQTRG